MGLFNIFKKKEPLTDEQIKWNYLWELWSQEEIGAPYDALMTYDSEINNGGHAQFFYNVSNCGDLAKAIKNLREVLPTDLGDNLQKAYDVFLKSAEEENEELKTDCAKVVALLEKEFKKILSPLDLELVHKWIYEDKFSYSKIYNAILETLKLKKTSIQYVDVILNKKENVNTNSSKEGLQDLFNQVYGKIK